MSNTTTPPARPRANCAALWDALPPDAQRRIGVTVTALALALLAQLEDDAPVAEAIEVEHLVEQFMSRLVDVAAEMPLPIGQLPDLNSIGVRACRVCSCTEERACPGGCSWVEEDLCSACAPGTAP